MGVARRDPLARRDSGLVQTTVCLVQTAVSLVQTAVCLGEVRWEEQVPEERFKAGFKAE